MGVGWRQPKPLTSRRRKQVVRGDADRGERVVDACFVVVLLPLFILAQIKKISTRAKTSGGIATGAAVAGRTAVAAVAVAARAALARAQVPAGRAKGVPVGEDEAPGARLAPGRLLVRALVVGGGAAAAHGGVGQIAHGLW